MSIKMMKKIGVATVGATGLALATMANAATPVPQYGGYVFNAPNIQLTKSVFGIPVTLTCDTALYGQVSENGSGDIVIEVTDGAVYGGSSSQCTNVELVFDDSWYASDSSTAPGAPGSVPVGLLQTTSDTSPKDVNGYFHNVQVSTPIGDCGGSIPVVYNNNEVFGGTDTPSSFEISGTLSGILGSCTIDGTFSATSSAGGFTGTAADIDIYQ